MEVKSIVKTSWAERRQGSFLFHYEFISRNFGFQSQFVYVIKKRLIYEKNILDM